MKAKLIRESLNELYGEDWTSTTTYDSLNKENKEKKIKAWLDKMRVENYTINDDYTIDVNGNVYLAYKNLDKFPDYIQFGNVEESFYCDYNLLTSLRGSPKFVKGIFCCDNNQLTSLEGAPKYVGGNFWCDYNNLTSLEGAPEYIGNVFSCRANKNQFDIEEVRSICKVGGDIFV